MNLSDVVTSHVLPSRDVKDRKVGVFLVRGETCTKSICLQELSVTSYTESLEIKSRP